MLPNLPSAPKDVSVTPQKVEVVLSEEGANPLIAVMPPLEDIAQMHAFANTSVSLASDVAKSADDMAANFSLEFKRLSKKTSYFQKSATFLNRLANLASLSGKFEEESALIDKAWDLSQEEFFRHKRADNLIAHERFTDAREFLSSMDLEHDVYSNLRLAYMYVQQNEMVAAEERIEAALESDPLDFRARLFEGGLRLVQGQFDQALFSFRIAEQANPRSVALCTNIAIAHAGLGRFRRALRLLKKAVALDPLNARAVLMLADVAFQLEEDDEALPSLLYFTHLEGNNVHIWRRAARASFRLEKYADTIYALKREGAVAQSSGVWNNLGVAYLRAGENAKALQAFKYAFEFSKPADSSGRLAARNLAQFLTNHSPKSVLEFVGPIITGEDAQVYLEHPVYSDIYVFAIVALRKDASYESVLELSYSLLEQSKIADRLAIWIVGNLISYFALKDGGADSSSILELISRYRDLAFSESHDPFRREMFFNNVAYSLAEMDRLSEARDTLAVIQQSIRKSAYPTATLGLINIREGNIDRGIELYEAAIALGETQFDKTRIKQKLNFELARYLGDRDPRRATRLLTRVIKEKNGEDLLVARASRLLRKNTERQRGLSSGKS